MEILHRSFPERWDVVQAKAIGRWAARDTSIFTALLQHYAGGEPSHIQHCRPALNESLMQGGSAKLPPALTPIDLA
jgi:hypothetical protein